MKKLKNFIKKSTKKAVASLAVISVTVSFLGMTMTTQNAVAQPAPTQMCDAEVDVVLAIDISGSMDKGTCTINNIVHHDVFKDWCDAWGGTFTNSRMETAKIAANNFLGYLGSNDQSALISFNFEETLDKELTSDHSLTKDKVDDLIAGGGTNIGPALALALQELESIRANSQAVKVLILLADGASFNSNYVKTQADIAKAAGIVVFTIGLGSDIDDTLLKYIAFDEDAYYHAPSATDLEGIYDSIRYRTCQLGIIESCKYGTDPAGNNQSIETGWEFTLEGNGYSQTQLTDEYGCTAFVGLSPGPYTLSEGNNPGIFEQKYPVVDNGTYIIDLQEGDHLTYDFGNYFPSCGNGTCDTNYGEDCNSCPADCGECEPNTVTIVATKIVCDNEESLPNWGAGGPDITANTATEFVAANPGCQLQEGWSFQVGDQNAVKYPGDYYGEAPSGDGWTTFGPTDSNGVVETTVILAEDTEQLRLREVLPTEEEHIPFTYNDSTGDNSNDVSAEFYCANDVYKYDNYDYIRDPQVGETYFCVAFNAEIYNPVYECSDGIDNDQDTLVDADDPGCWGDPTDPSTYDPTDDNEDNDALPECSDYLDNDQDGYIDEDDATCFRNGYYDPTLDNEQNQRPVITVDPATITITVGDSFDPINHATATDPEDGDITGNIFISGDTVNTSIVGIYHVVYDVEDSEGLDAVTGNLEVIVEEEPEPEPYCEDGVCNGNETCSSCPQDCGECYIPPTPPSSGGGGGIIPLSTNNYQECEVVGNTATFTWMTNKPSSSQVVCDPNGHNSSWTSGPDWGYSIFTDVFDNPLGVTNHSVEIELSAGMNYCWILSSDGGIRPVKEELICLVPEIAEVSEEIPPVAESCSCPQLLETHIKLGAQNNSNDVRGLEWALNEMGYGPLPINGNYEQHDYEAVKRLQEDNSEKILVPWGINSTGYVYLTTQKFINEWYCDYRGCPREFPLTDKQNNEINYYKGFAALTETLKIKK